MAARRQSKEEYCGFYKKIEKEIPDSSRIIADICLDADSLAWRSAIRKDSIDESTKRLWAPGGLTDAAIMKLKVRSLPYYIVFDKDGVQRYSGDDLSQAIKDYKNLVKGE